jgi:aryl-alcohol dehydrogenase (NADP+)
MLPLCRDEGIGVIPWSPLARGFLAGNRKPGAMGDTQRAKTDDYAHQLYYRESDFEVAARVTEVAKVRNVTPAQVALAWMLQQPGITAPILGFSRMHHLKEAVAALDITLSKSEVESLEEPYQPHPILGHS